MLLAITAASLALALVMTVVAWRLAREERRRSAARVATLAGAIHDEQGDDRPPGPLFAASAARRSAPWVMPLAAIAVVVVVSVVLATLTTSGRTASSELPAQTDSGPVMRHPQASFRPLELVALGQEREGDRLTVRGVVRNPADGSTLERLAVVVFLFDHNGFVTSGRAAVDPVSFVGGSESPFAVTVTGAAHVERYRLSFRTGDRVVAHVDRRDRATPSELP
jgi:hypothetical protein